MIRKDIFYQAMQWDILGVESLDLGRIGYYSDRIPYFAGTSTRICYEIVTNCARSLDTRNIRLDWQKYQVLTRGISDLFIFPLKQIVGKVIPTETCTVLVPFQQLLHSFYSLLTQGHQ